MLSGCDLPGWKRGWKYVFDHLSYSLSDSKGRFQIAKVPPDKYQLELRQADGGCSRMLSIIVKAGKTTQVELQV